MVIIHFRIIVHDISLLPTPCSWNTSSVDITRCTFIHLLLQGIYCLKMHLPTEPFSTSSPRNLRVHPINTREYVDHPCYKCSLHGILCHHFELDRHLHSSELKDGLPIGGLVISKRIEIQNRSATQPHLGSGPSLPEAGVRACPDILLTSASKCATSVESRDQYHQVPCILGERHTCPLVKCLPWCRSHWAAFTWPSVP